MRSSAVLNSSLSNRRSSTAWIATSESVTDFLTLSSSRGKGFRPAPVRRPPCLAIEPDDLGIRLNLSAKLIGNVCRVSDAVGLSILRASRPFAAYKLLGALADFGFGYERSAIGDDELLHWIDLSCVA